MARKTKEVKNIETTELDELVNEGKNVDMVKVSEVLEEKRIERKIKENEETKVTEQIVVAQEEEVGETKEEETEEAKSIEQIEENTTNINHLDLNEEIETEVEGDIDDVITECTGSIEEPKETIIKNNKEPWYVARAKRISDYYSW